MENYFFLENYATSEGAVSHNVYTINLSPLLVTEKGFMLIIILRNYQKCPLPLMLADWQLHLYEACLTSITYGKCEINAVP